MRLGEHSWKGRWPEKSIPVCLFLRQVGGAGICSEWQEGGLASHAKHLNLILEVMRALRVLSTEMPDFPFGQTTQGGGMKD